ncbi:MAG: 3-hydroxyacyl-CoA dehydrogenase NAD-binding domain-containing protein [Nitrospiraceae bacterium]|nr:3-hydroxyacyl-CoA dehydrogenase NAD-binding domain-containing protein [Nitrospiraceae bacterium]
MEIRTIAVIGAGTMGGGIAQTAAGSGFDVILEDVSEGLVVEGLGKIERRLETRVAEGKLESGGKNAIVGRIRTGSTLEYCRGADLVIEAVIEKEEAKKEIFTALDVLCPPETIFATNTSSIQITRLAGSTKRPDRFIGMHFMNPAYVMKLVEIVKGVRTSQGTVDTAKKVCDSMGKVPVVVDDSPGFVSNRVLMPLINEAVFCLQEGVAPREGIDTVMKLGAHHPMGPLELADFIGLDTCLEILEILEAELGEKFRPAPLLRRMVASGKLGRKNREGFYEYR